MRLTNWVQRIVLAAAVAGVLPLALPQAPAPDNTAVNKRDRNKAAKTADQANQNAPDRELMRKIRRSIMDDKSLSTYAHNVKVIAENGKVTLKGPVRTEDEKRSVEAKAVEVAGTGNVTNEISVSPGKGDKSKTADAPH
ncbi:MAG TPA: BON domain-containing protein [Bryobacteraceae bacterium]|nr:BON domain-containing protein [Bryobacteraceae bacterium]